MITYGIVESATPFILLAATMAHKSDSKYRLGAVLVKKKRVVSTGYNDMSRSHPIMRRYAPHGKIIKNLHAEVDCCIGLSPEEMNGTTMYVTRVLKNGLLASSKPCKICHKFLTTMGVKRVIYTNTEGGLEMETL